MANYHPILEKYRDDLMNQASILSLGNGLIIFVKSEVKVAALMHRGRAIMKTVFILLTTKSFFYTCLLKPKTLTIPLDLQYHINISL
ncbi:MAG: hypothetical protein IPP77_13010 [Bacteroidetes bacterium]|nr:hypothetical protein [Bacteroidota bacterium]